MNWFHITPYEINALVLLGMKIDMRLDIGTNKLTRNEINYAVKCDWKLNICYFMSSGFCKIGKMVDLEVPIPRRKITVLLVGNHSAGKSSFINW